MLEKSKFRKPVFPEMKVKANVKALRSRGQSMEVLREKCMKKKKIVCEFNLERYDNG